MLLLLACGGGGGESGPTPEPLVPSARSSTPSGHQILARVEGRPIRAAEVDAGLAIALHDLDLARYRLRQERLLEIVEGRRGPRAMEAEILLEAPAAPRLALPLEGARMRGAEQAPVTLVEFIDFQSTPSRALQPLLERLLEDYPDRVRLAVRDLPLPYHRWAQSAAEAARCAGDQEAYWPYHAILLQEQPRLESQHLTAYARRLGLDLEAFENCLGSRRHTNAVAGDAALAGLLGIPRAPSLFANGLYLPPPFDYADLVDAVQREAGAHTVSTPLSPGGPEPGAPPPAPADDPTGRAPLPAIFPEQLLEPEAIIDLPPRVIRQALAERPRLEARLAISPGTFSGRRLLKLDTVEPGDLYDRFGLQPGDVLLLVDDQWVTDESNPLWQALERGDDITLLIMRKGLPHRFRYRIR
ncbi:MAG: thioredoxin domain-containing protein [Myxococcota bacterium]|nr:thioredoxin domain-containing protein [Myxococcota bacterium]